jgi:hypothetical protein
LVASCYDPRGCDRMFNHRFARHTANRYRKCGLDKTARRMVELIAQNGLEGATVLEVSGGVGDIQVEPLKRGAAGTTNLELLPVYEPKAHRLVADMLVGISLLGVITATVSVWFVAQTPRRRQSGRGRPASRLARLEAILGEIHAMLRSDPTMAPITTRHPVDPSARRHADHAPGQATVPALEQVDP